MILRTEKKKWKHIYEDIINREGRHYLKVQIYANFIRRQRMTSDIEKVKPLRELRLNC